MKKLILSFVIVLIILGTVVAALWSSSDPETQKLGFEIAKLSTQLILIVVFGGILVQEYNRKRERKTALNDFRKMIMRELIRAYAGIKKARRLLRAKCLSKENGENKESEEIPYEVYERQIHDINDVQLQLEILIHEIDTFQDAFTDSSDLRSQLAGMEEYLHRLISEYEKVSAFYDKQATCIPLTKLEELEKFIHRGQGTERSKFGKEFTPLFRRSLEIIRAESLKI